MSVFSGLNAQSLAAVIEAAKRSPQGLAALAVAGIIALLALGLAVAYAARHIGGFYARIEREEEDAARESAASEDAACAQGPPPAVHDGVREDENGYRGEGE